MKSHHVLVFCFLSAALCAGNSGTAYAINIYMGPEGGNGTMTCYLSSSANTKFFCRKECKGDDLLIKTDGVLAQSGRYSIKYKGESSGRKLVSVTITHLTKSDAGRYRCGVGESSISRYSEFGVRVSNGLLGKDSGFTRTETEGGKVTYGCGNTVPGNRKFLCKNQCKGQGDVLIDTNDNITQSGRYSLKYDAGSAHGLYVTINQLTRSDTGWYRCGYGNPSSADSYRDDWIIVTEDLSASTPQTETLRSTLRSTSQSFTVTASSPATDQPTASGCLSSWALSGPIVAVLLLAVFLLLLYIWRSRKSSGFTSRDNAVDTNVELSGKCENSVYESLCTSSTNQDQAYSELSKA